MKRHRSDRGISASTQQALSGYHKPFRDRRVNNTIVACLSCHMPIGKGCVTIEGNKSPTAHAVRRRMALKASLLE